MHGLAHGRTWSLNSMAAVGRQSCCASLLVEQANQSGKYGPVDSSANVFS